MSEGEPFWGLATHKCGVLYLALEDVYARIQQRLWRITDAVGGSVHFAVASESLSGGLVEQLESFMAQHPDTGLVIVDTLQIVRSASRESAYAADYGDVGALKRFADSFGVAMLLIHHTRKMGDADVFNTVSGTTGITGSADSTLVLSKASRCDGSATLSIAGRDVEFQELKLRCKDCRWELVERTSKEELEERTVPEAVLRVLDFMATQPCQWQGTAPRLIEEAGIEGVSVAVLGKYLAQHSSFLAERGVSYARKHMRDGNILSLAKVPREGGEGNEG